MNITLIAALSKNNAIGLDNQLLWHLPNDLKHFKSLTSGFPIVMGRKTFESIGKALPNRDNIILTNNHDWKAPHTKIFHSIEAILNDAKINHYEKLFIIGGSEIYEQFMPLAHTLEITQVDTDLTGDRFFPDISSKQWICTSKKSFSADDKHPYAYHFLTYSRIS